MSVLGEIKSDLKKASDKDKAKLLAKFFKTGKGQYGEGDKFLGIMMPDQRVIAKKYASRISIEDTLKLLKGEFHEQRMIALLVLMMKYQNGEKSLKQRIFSAYLANTKFINNWDLIDVTCPRIVGDYLLEKDRSILYKLAKSKNLWKKRIAIISTAHFISRNDLTDTFKIAKILLNDKHDLIHKAVGWMLREAGKKDEIRLIRFLEKNRLRMPRTMLRYAIEKFSTKRRAKLMKRY